MNEVTNPFAGSGEQSPFARKDSEHPIEPKKWNVPEEPRSLIVNDPSFDPSLRNPNEPLQGKPLDAAHQQDQSEVGREVTATDLITGKEYTKVVVAGEEVEVELLEQLRLNLIAAQAGRDISDIPTPNDPYWHARDAFQQEYSRSK